MPTRKFEYLANISRQSVRIIKIQAESASEIPGQPRTRYQKYFNVSLQPLNAQQLAPPSFPNSSAQSDIGRMF